jgi:hypothetical protein
MSLKESGTEKGLYYLAIRDALITCWEYTIIFPQSDLTTSKDAKEAIIHSRKICSAKSCCIDNLSITTYKLRTHNYLDLPQILACRWSVRSCQGQPAWECWKNALEHNYRNKDATKSISSYLGSPISVGLYGDVTPH